MKSIVLNNGWDVPIGKLVGGAFLVAPRLPFAALLGFMAHAPINLR